MATESKNFQEKKLFQVVRELNVSEDRVVEFLESKGYGEALSGSGLNAKIIDEEAYLVLLENYGEDVEGQEVSDRIQELRSEDDEDLDQDTGKTLERKNFQENKVFQVARDLNVSGERVVEFLESKGYGEALSGSGLNAKIVDEEAHLVLLENYGEDVEGQEVPDRIQELQSEDDDDLNQDTGKTLDNDDDPQEESPASGREEVVESLKAGRYRLKGPSVVGKMDSDQLQRPDRKRRRKKDPKDQEKEESEGDSDVLAKNNANPSDILSKKNFSNKPKERSGIPKSHGGEDTNIEDLKDEIRLLELEIEDIGTLDKFEHDKRSKNFEVPEGLDVKRSYNGSYLVDKVKKHSSNNGFYYREETIARLFDSITTEDLTILVGMSGTGKSALPKLLAEAVGGKFVKIPVKPNWVDEHDLLGYYNPSEKDYYPTRLVKGLRMAEEEKERLFLFCLDEMNLAKPENYFARFLSRMEGEGERTIKPDESMNDEEIANARVNLKNEHPNDKDLVSKKLKILESYSEIRIPRNVKFVGTVNIDGTTESISSKVIDRSNSIYIQKDELDKAIFSNEGVHDLNEEILKFKRSKKYGESKEEAEEYILESFRKIKSVSESLDGSEISFGYRIVDGILRYVKNSKENKTVEFYKNEKEYEDCIKKYDLEDKIEVDDIKWYTKILDLQIIQRVLPKINARNNEDMESTLSELKECLTNESLLLSRRAVELMEESGGRGYVSFWEYRSTS
jgi:hypothetical protein